MTLKRLSDVNVGQMIKIGGATYKVTSKGTLPTSGVNLQKQVLPGFLEPATIAIQSLIPNFPGNAHQLVNVVEGASGSQSDLTSQLRKQVGQKSLTDSLKAQLDDDGTDDYDSIWDEEEDFEEDEECDCEDCRAADEQASAMADNIFGQLSPSYPWETIQATSIQPFSIEPVKFNVPGVEEAKKSALSANLSAQVAQGQANQARLDATIAKSSVQSVRQEVKDTQSSVHNLAFEVDAVARHNEELSEEVYVLSSRVNEITKKQLEEEKKVNLQNELNRKLAQSKVQADVQAQLNQKLNQKTTGGNGTMKNVLGAFKNQFGKVEGKFAFSPITGGLALRKGISQDFVAYNAATGELTDVSGLTLKFDVPAFKLPIGEKDVNPGDLVIHNGEFVYVTKKSDGYLETINPEKAVRGSVIPTKNALLGAAFYTVVKTLDAAGQGGFNPMLLMALNKGGSSSDLLPLLLASGGIGGGATGGIDPTMLMLLGDDVEDLLPLVLMQQGGATGAGFNPLMFLAMNKGGKSKDLLPLLMMSGGLQGGAQAGGMNPMMMMALAGDGDIDFTTLALMGGMNGGGLFGQAPAVASKEVKAPKEAK